MRLRSILMLGLCAILLVGLGGLVVSAHILKPAGSFGTWQESGGSLPEGAETETGATTTATAATFLQGTTSVPKITANSGSAKPQPETSDAEEYNSILSQISHPQTSRNTESGSASGFNVWPMLPTGLISTSTSKAQTPTQQALFAYGNAAGSIVKGYDDSHTGQASALDSSIRDRKNAQKAAAVAQIGTDLQNVGIALGNLSAPPLAQSYNAALAQSYQDAGAKLIAVSQATAGDDKGLVAAIEAYDASVSPLTKSFVAVSTLLSSNEVSFSSSDSGSVFMFSPQ